MNPNLSQGGAAAGSAGRGGAATEETCSCGEFAEVSDFPNFVINWTKEKLIYGCVSSAFTNSDLYMDMGPTRLG